MLGRHRDGSGDPADSDFSKVITMLETARQGALYGDYDNGRFFNGEVDECSKKVLGFSCCDTKVKAGTANSSAFGKAMSFARRRHRRDRQIHRQSLRL